MYPQQESGAEITRRIDCGDSFSLPLGCALIRDHALSEWITGSLLGVCNWENIVLASKGH